MCRPGLVLFGQAELGENVKNKINQSEALSAILRIRVSLFNKSFYQVWLLLVKSILRKCKK